MDIKLLKVNNPFSEYEKYLPFATEERLEKIKSLKCEHDKALSLLSHLLARCEVSKAMGIPFEAVVFSYNEHGKPYVEKENYHFSISHSGNLIAFVSHTSPIGIDLQKITGGISPAVRFFTENEKCYIKNDTERFFEVWTKKEAYIKMLGTGLSKPLSSFDVLTESVRNMLFSTSSDNYSISVCAENLPKINIRTQCV